MAARKNPLSDKAFELYRGGMKLKDIAAELEVPPGTVRRWKNNQNWESGRSESKANAEGERSETEVSWLEIENEYVTDLKKKPCSLEEIAKKYNIPLQTVKDRSAAGQWSKKRTEYKLNTSRKIREKTADADADRIARLLGIADMAADRAEQALAELETYQVRKKTKTKTVEYKDPAAPGKPTKEVIQEEETIEQAAGPVDRLGLSQITGALRNIKELYSLQADMDSRKYRAEYERRRAEVGEDSGEELLRNMQTITDILRHPAENRRIEDFEEETDESAGAVF